MLIRLTKRCFINGSLYEPGQQVRLQDGQQGPTEVMQSGGTRKLYVEVQEEQPATPVPDQTTAEPA